MKYVFYFTATLLLLLQPAKNGDSQQRVTPTPITPNTDLIKKVDAKQQEISALIDKIPEPKRIIQYRTKVKIVYIHDTILVPVPEIVAAEYFPERDTVLIHDTTIIRKPLISIFSRKN